MQGPPRNCASAQQFFNKQRRISLKTEEPGLKGEETAERLKDEWGKMDAAARAPYQQLAAEDKARYQAEMANYRPDPSLPMPSLKRPAGLREDPLKPKKPRNAFFFFGEATRQELTSMEVDLETMNTLILDEWKTLSDEQKSPYEQQALFDRQRYDREIATYRPSPGFVIIKKPSKRKSEAGPSGGGGGGEDGEGEEGEGEDDDDLEVVEVSVVVNENKMLKKMITQLEKEKGKMAKEIEGLKEKLEKAKEEKQGAKEEAKAAKQAAKEEGGKVGRPKKAKTEEAEDTPAAPKWSKDPKHYLDWVKTVLGENGEKAELDMYRALQSKGPKGLAKMLVKRYKAEHKE